MYTVRYGGPKGRVVRLAEDPGLLVVRTASRAPIDEVPLSPEAHEVLRPFEVDFAFEPAGVAVLRQEGDARSRAARDAARRVLKGEKEIEFAGRVLVQSNPAPTPAQRAARSGRRGRAAKLAPPPPKAAVATPIVYTENFFVKFDDDLSERRATSILKEYGLSVKRAVEYVRNGYFVAAPEDTGQKIFDIAEKLIAHEHVELCHPEIVRRLSRRTAAPQQWHLAPRTINGQAINAHATVEAAWALTRGEGTVIAIIDDGVDIDHEEFGSSGKIVAPRDQTRKTDDPRPRNAGDRHGNACAGVACADGNFGASGVAPAAKLIPIRLASALGSQDEADAIFWAAQHGADVISCSWGPFDGDWTNPADPLHNQNAPLPDSTRAAIDWAVQNGRNGKGCVICWAAGNGNESVDLDGYASYPKVIAVAACNDQGTKSAYSDFGNAVWCAFPSNHGFPSLTPGVWTTDRTGGAGYNPGNTAKGDAAGNYTNSFGGTSSAAPGAAGVAALVIARNGALRWDQVRDILKNSADRIDPAGGAYDAQGHSAIYGYGRLNALQAVQAAAPAQATRTIICSVRQDVPINDNATCSLSLAIGETGPGAAVRVTVDIEHTYIGDLAVTITPPVATGVGAITLHDHSGGGTDNLKLTYDAVNAPGLAALAGKSPAGAWKLTVSDNAAQDTGVVRGFGVEVSG